jgi:hypothetical protein
MRRSLSTHNRRLLDLRHDQRAFVATHPHARIEIVYGNAWLTQHGDLVDHFLRHGDGLTLGTGGGVLIEALTLTRVAIDETQAAAPWLRAAAAPIRRLVSALSRNLRERAQLGSVGRADATY